MGQGFLIDTNILVFTLVTRNQKDFKGINGLKIYNPFMTTPPNQLEEESEDMVKVPEDTKIE
jgi:hypothetical protein